MLLEEGLTRIRGKPLGTVRQKWKITFWIEHGQIIQSVGTVHVHVTGDEEKSGADIGEHGTISAVAVSHLYLLLSSPCPTLSPAMLPLQMLPAP